MKSIIKKMGTAFSQMNIMLALTIFFVACLFTITSCKKDKQKPQTAPTVKTLMATSDQPTTATVTGEITDDGNSTITEAGFVYSSNVDMPTTADNKKIVANVNSFNAELTGLNSGTTYNVRAYAINSKGTAYGEKKTFTTNNAAPTVTNVSITGTLEVGKTVTASYTYVDAENDTQGETTFQWYTADNSNGTNETLITGAVTDNFDILDAHNGKFLRVAITPKALTGTTTGVEVKSSFTIEVGAETVTFMYNGASVTYGTIMGSSGRKWLDRNLGANQMAENVNDHLAFGDMYQWGRLSDGHQLVNRTGPNAENMSGANGTTSQVEPYATSSNNDPQTNQFIFVRGAVLDWRAPQFNNLWQSPDQINNPCPEGWRLPTANEWVAEGITSAVDAYSKLKLTLAGERTNRGVFRYSTLYGEYWSSTSEEIEQAPGLFYSNFFNFDESSAGLGGAKDRGYGLPCRCIKE